MTDARLGGPSGVRSGVLDPPPELSEKCVLYRGVYRVQFLTFETPPTRGLYHQSLQNRLQIIKTHPGPRTINPGPNDTQTLHFVCNAGLLQVSSSELSALLRILHVCTPVHVGAILQRLSRGRLVDGCDGTEHEPVRHKALGDTLSDAPHARFSATDRFQTTACARRKATKVCGWPDFIIVLHFSLQVWAACR